MADFPTDLTNAVDGTTQVLAKHINNLEAKVGVDSSTVTTSLDYRVSKIEDDYVTLDDAFWATNQSLWGNNYLLFAEINGNVDDYTDDLASGTLANGATLTTGVKGISNTAILFDENGGGGDDSLLYYESKTRQHTFSEISVIFLVNPESPTTGVSKRIFSKGSDSCVQISQAGTGNIIFTTYVSSVAQELWSGASDLSVNNWNWVICTRRSADGFTAIYTKNTANGLTLVTGSKTSGDMDNNTSLFNFGSIDGWLGFEGKMSHLFILDRFISRPEAVNFLNHVTV